MGYLAATEKKGKKGKSLKFLFGYLAGFSCWLVGLPCFEEDSQGRVFLSWPKLLKHLRKVFLWALELTLLYHLFGMYFNWLLGATSPEKSYGDPSQVGRLSLREGFLAQGFT